MDIRWQITGICSQCEHQRRDDWPVCYDARARPQDSKLPQAAQMAEQCTALTPKGLRCSIFAGPGKLTCSNPRHATQHILESEWLPIGELPASTSQCVGISKTGARCSEPSEAGQNCCRIPRHQDQKNLGSHYLRKHLHEVSTVARATRAPQSLLAPEPGASSSSASSESAEPPVRVSGGLERSDTQTISGPHTLSGQRSQGVSSCDTASQLETPAQQPKLVPGLSSDHQATSYVMS